MARVETVDEFRALKAAKTPMWLVDWLPYVGSPFMTPGSRHGTEEDVFTTLAEARARFEQLSRKESLVERVALRKHTVGLCSTLLDEWADEPTTTDEEEG